MSSFTTFTDGQRTAAGFIAVGAAFSTFAISIAIARVALVALWPIIQGKGLKARRDSMESIFYHTQLGLYAACLLVANLLSSSGALIEIQWASQGGIQQGGICSTQGALIQIGDFGVAYFTTTMALHTLNSLVLKRRYPVWFMPTLIFVGWFAAILIGAAAESLSTKANGPYYNNVGVWCWVSDAYPGAQFGLHYLWTILAQITTSLIYVFIYLRRRGYIYMDPNQAMRLKFRWKVPKHEEHCDEGCLDGSDDYCHFLEHIAKVMLLFPLSYIILLLPITASRIAEIAGDNVSYEVFSFSAVIASLLGLVNVLILYVILRVLAPAYKSSHGSQGSPDVESFFTPERAPTPPPPPMEKPPPARPARPFPPPNSRVVSMVSEPYPHPGDQDYVKALNDVDTPVRYAQSLSGDVQRDYIPMEPYRFPPHRPHRRMGMPSNPRPTLRTQTSHRRFNTDPSPSSASTGARLIKPSNSDGDNRVSKHSHSASDTSAATSSSFGRAVMPADAFVIAAAMPSPENVLTREATGFRPSHRRAQLTIGSASSADSLGTFGNRPRPAPQAWLQTSHPTALVPGARMRSPGSQNSSSPLSSANTSRSPEYSSSGSKRLLSPPSRELSLSLSSGTSSPPSNNNSRQLVSPQAMPQPLSPVVEVDYNSSIKHGHKASQSSSSKRHGSIMSIDDLSPVPTVPRPKSRAQNASNTSAEDIQVIPRLSPTRSRANSFDSLDSLPLAEGEDSNVEVEVAVHTPTAFPHEQLIRSESLISMYLERPKQVTVDAAEVPPMPVPAQQQQEHSDGESYPRAELEVPPERQPDSDPEYPTHVWHRTSTQKSDSVIDMYLSRSPPPDSFRISMNVDHGPLTSLEAIIMATGLGQPNSVQVEEKKHLSPVEEMDVPVTALPLTAPLFSSPESTKSLKLPGSRENSSSGDSSLHAELKLRMSGLPDMPGLSSPGWAALVTKAAFGENDSPVDNDKIRQAGHAKSNSEGHIPIGLAPVPGSARSLLPSSPRNPDRPESIYEEVSFFRPASVITLDRREHSRRHRRQ